MSVSLTPADVDRAALVDRLRRILREPVEREPAAQLDLGDHRAVEFLRDRDVSPRWSSWPWRERDEVAALRARPRPPGTSGSRSGMGRRRSRLPSGRVEPERRVAEPGQFGRHARNLVARTAERRGRVGREVEDRLTTKNEPTVTTTAAPTAVASSRSRGGAPPTATTGAATGAAHVQPAHDVQVVRERDRRRGDADEHEPPVARLVGGGEHEQLPEHAARQREAGEAEHEDPERGAVERPLPAEAGERLERDRLARALARGRRRRRTPRPTSRSRARGSRGAPRAPRSRSAETAMSMNPACEIDE